MRVVGLTGGIGSGKSTVAKMFESLGVPVYIADERAKKLMNTQPNLIKQLKELLGEKAYDANGLNRAYIAQKVFTDKALLQQLNNIVHPAVADDFKVWVENQKTSTPYVIKEAAILFENGGYKNFDFTILVTAPEESRITRVMKRDGVTRQSVLDRIENQWSDSEKVVLADIVISNRDLEKTLPIVKKIHNKILFKR
ncbi:dephospho-CoA kinase [Aquimarina brevivitae]|uniref:Dephospho-CoA kinase n=1 Tax=Aquimarina brevivitae TaxID=323412 RepID=A0A4Q7NZV9_9FLAO|nr:dephospho-CoA kinase [Aquimarina brevivitae]RZS92600.1 dephospho-CoA kinase [Aquimarina brevivitae]